MYLFIFIFFSFFHFLSIFSEISRFYSFRQDKKCEKKRFKHLKKTFFSNILIYIQILYIYIIVNNIFLNYCRFCLKNLLLDVFLRSFYDFFWILKLNKCKKSVRTGFSCTFIYFLSSFCHFFKKYFIKNRLL